MAIPRPSQVSCESTLKVCTQQYQFIPTTWPKKRYPHKSVDQGYLDTEAEGCILQCGYQDKHNLHSGIRVSLHNAFSLGLPKCV